MQNMGLLMEYEDILLKKRKDFSATYIGQNASQKDIKELFQYVFENLLEWTPEMAKDYLTMDIIQKLHLMRPLRKLEYPPEINIDQDLFSVAWMVYPEQIHISRHELVLNVYQKVLSDKLIKYPKKFFLEADGEVNACICLLYAINQEMPSHNIEDLYAFFCNRPKVTRFLRNVRLNAPCHSIFEYPIDFLHAALPDNQKNELCYRYERFKMLLKEQKDIIKKRNEVSSEHEVETKEPIHAKKKRTKGKSGKQNK